MKCNFQSTISLFLRKKNENNLHINSLKGFCNLRSFSNLKLTDDGLTCFFLYTLLKNQLFKQWAFYPTYLENRIFPCNRTKKHNFIVSVIREWFSQNLGYVRGNRYWSHVMSLHSTINFWRAVFCCEVALFKKKNYKIQQHYNNNNKQHTN